MTVQKQAAQYIDTTGQVNRPTDEYHSQGTLRDVVHRSLARYFEQLDGQPVSDLYAMVLNEVEAPLFSAVMEYSEGNQSKASDILGLNRGTLRKKLKQYGLLKSPGAPAKAAKRTPNFPTKHKN